MSAMFGAGQVRNSNLLADEDEYGLSIPVEWEKIERQGEEAIKRWINSQLQYTSVTVVLIGAQTSERSWVDYEIRESWKRGNGLVGIRIHNIKNQSQMTDQQGLNPFDQIKFTDGRSLSSVCKTYDWVLGDGRNNLGKWIEEAAKSRGK
ncbi:MAG: TIR domain-containing protein [Candidatus Gracilibacteria bacterium]